MREVPHSGVVAPVSQELYDHITRLRELLYKEFGDCAFVIKTKVGTDDEKLVAASGKDGHIYPEAK